jgi:hypothetical protein
MGVRLGAAICAAVVSFACGANATVVTFDDLTGLGVVADGYAGITWNGDWNYYDLVQPPYNPASPLTRVFDTKSTAVFNFSAPVSFDGADFAGASFASVEFQLYLAGNLVGTSGSLTTSDTPTFLASGYGGLVDEVRVVSPSPDYFVMDNVTYNPDPAVVPEPVSWAMMLLGFFGLGAGLRARRKVALTA